MEFQRLNGIKGKLIQNSKYEKLLSKENQKIDSLFIIDSLNIGNKSFVYIKSTKTLKNSNYDFPPVINEIDILIYDNLQYEKKLNIYYLKVLC